MTENESKAMPSAIGQPYPASEKEFVTPVPNTKTADTSMSEEHAFSEFATDHTKVKRLTEIFLD
tara:strand:+ start:15753 stop:15944 length:192 start_codon:yes stop_codon:yes gene_type:complete